MVPSQLVSDGFWERLQPLLPTRERRFRYPGRKRIDDRVCLEAIAYVLRTGCQWRMVPAEQIGCSGVTAWRRMDEWIDAGVWDALHEELLAELNASDEIDWTTGVIDAGSQRAVFGGSSRALTPLTERRRASRVTR
jgi:transposase